MIRAINVWAIFHPAQGLLLHSVHANQRGAWAMLNYGRPDFPMRSEGELRALGFRAVQVRLKFGEPDGEGKP